MISDAEVATMERSACPTCGSCSGMFTANSMNCLTEALGLSLPGNGSLLATHADRKQLFLRAGRLIVELAKRYYEQDDDMSVLPRSIATFEAFENAMALDIAMGGSTNTVLHLLAAAHEAGVDFTMKDIDRLSRKVPHLCKVAPSIQKYHMEDVHRAGGIMAILGELDRAGLLHRDLPTVHSPTMGEALEHWDVMPHHDEAGENLLPRRARRRADPGRVQPGQALSPSSISTAPTAASATRPTPTRRTAAWPCCTATSPRTAASSRPPAWTRASSSSPAGRASSKARKRRWKPFSPTRSWPATWW